MLNRRLLFGLPVVMVILALAFTQAAMAQPEGTVNLKSAEIYEGPTQGWGEVRFWSGSNETIALGLTRGIDENMDGTLSLVDIDVSGKDPVAGVVRASRVRLLTVDVKRMISEDAWTVSVNPGLEFALSGPRGTNTNLGASATWGDVIPTLGILFERVHEDGTLTINPKMARWRSSATATNQQVVRGFGTVVGIGIGWHRQMSPRLQLSADVTPILRGKNTINKTTNAVDKDVVWGLGASYLLSEGRSTWVSAFCSNAFGPTGATSLLAAPDNSACFGVRVDSTF